MADNIPLFTPYGQLLQSYDRYLIPTAMIWAATFENRSSYNRHSLVSNSICVSETAKCEVRIQCFVVQGQRGLPRNSEFEKRGRPAPIPCAKFVLRVYWRKCNLIREWKWRYDTKLDFRILWFLLNIYFLLLTMCYGTFIKTLIKFTCVVGLYEPSWVSLN